MKALGARVFEQIGFYLEDVQIMRANAPRFDHLDGLFVGEAAERLGWNDRGFVREGCAADLVVLDRARLRDQASFESPDRFPTGIEKVFVNGVPVIDGDGYDANASAGRVLRS